MEKHGCILVKRTSLSTIKAIQILERAEDYPTICVPPCKPKAGEVYLFDLSVEKRGIRLNLTQACLPATYIDASMLESYSI